MRNRIRDRSLGLTEPKIYEFRDLTLSDHSYDLSLSQVCRYSHSFTPTPDKTIAHTKLMR